MDTKNPVFWTRLLGCGFGCVGFTVGHTLAPFRDPLLDSAIFLAGLTAWGIGVAGVKRLDGKTVIEQMSEEPRRVPNLNQPSRNGWVSLREGVVLEQTVKPVELQVLDPRIKQWAWAVTYENTSMVQTKWCGRKKLFSKPAYVAFIADMLKDGYLAPIDPNKEKSSYKPNGRKGREYIRDLAIGRAYRPYPTLTLDERSIHFLRAQMRKGYAEGEGVRERNYES